MAPKHVYQICEKIRTRRVSISHLKRANRDRTRILGSCGVVVGQEGHESTGNTD